LSDIACVPIITNLYEEERLKIVDIDATGIALFVDSKHLYDKELVILWFRLITIAII
jgi:hypothetical protein